MKISFVIPSLGSGGAERVISILANYWAEKDHEVAIFTFDDGRDQPFYELDRRIRLQPLGLSQVSSHVLSGIWNNINRLIVLKKNLTSYNPDVVISFMDTTNIKVILSLLFSDRFILVSERSDPQARRIGVYWKILRRLTYGFADGIVVQSRGAYDYFSRNFSSKLHIIPNPVVRQGDSDSHGAASLKFENPFIVAMGRLAEEKQYDLLLRAFASLKDRYPQWTLIILGEGPLRSKLEALRDALGLTTRVFLPGRVKAPHGVLAAADLFVMTSRLEGFPNALCEAMACGLPVISTDCPSGPREIIRDGLDGILVAPGDVEELAAAMGLLMTDEAKRKELAARAPEITTRFGLEKVASMWEGLFAGSARKRA